jgi:hypothetical protein
MFYFFNQIIFFDLCILFHTVSKFLEEATCIPFARSAFLLVEVDYFIRGSSMKGMPVNLGDWLVELSSGLRSLSTSPNLRLVQAL